MCAVEKKQVFVALFTFSWRKYRCLIREIIFLGHFRRWAKVSYLLRSTRAGNYRTAGISASSTRGLIENKLHTSIKLLSTSFMAFHLSCMVERNSSHGFEFRYCNNAVLQSLSSTQRNVRETAAERSERTREVSRAYRFALACASHFPWPSLPFGTPATQQPRKSPGNEVGQAG